MSEETLAARETALAALRPGGTGAVVETWCDLVWVEGPDAERFLQGTLTNDVAALAEGDSCEALLLEAKGRIRHGVVVHRDGAEAFTLVASPDHGEALCDDLEALHVSEDLEIFWDRARMAITNAAGDAGGEHLEVALRPAGLRGVVGGAPGEVARALGVPAVPREALDALRVEVGAADPDVDGAGRLVQEAGLDGVAVSFSKGCYLGQETVARASHRGGVRRRLVGVALDAPVAAGTVLRHDGREVGTTGTCARHPSLGPVALAVVRDGVPEGAGLAVEGRSTPARLLELPLAAA